LTILVDAVIGILIIFITVIPFVWKGKGSKYVLIASAIICISLYIFQGYSKNQEFERVKKENIVFQEDLNKQQKEIMQTQRVMIEKQNMFLSLLNKQQKDGTISKDEARKMANIYNETVSITAKASSKVEDKFLQAIKEAGSFEMKEATLFFDKENNLLWAIPKMESSCTWSKGNEYSRNFNTGGYTDWRMPSLTEAKITIEYIKRHKSILDLIEKFHKSGIRSTIKGLPLLNLRESYYWTSESRNNSAEAFHPHTGNIEESDKNSMKFVVLVRSL